MTKVSANQGVAIPAAETAPKSIIERLSIIQSSLKAPKSQYNSFGKYSYRKCEDILEALKPFLLEHQLSLVISDEVVLIGDRFYIKATASLSSIGAEGNSFDQIRAVGFAREESEKKGMDAAQITGATSSYARKYALNGLFCIDDSQDADSTNEHGKGTPTPPAQQNRPQPQAPSFKQERAQAASTTTAAPASVDVNQKFEEAKTYITNSKDKAAALAMVVKKYGATFSPEQIASLQGIAIPQLGEPVVVNGAAKV
jgi:hypothetical protein